MPKSKSKTSHKRLTYLFIVPLLIIGILFIPLLISNKKPDTTDVPVEMSYPIDRSTLVLAEQGDWLTYTSEEGGYSIMYPPNWEPIDVHSENGGIGFKLKDSEDSQNLLLIGVSISQNTEDKNLEQVVTEITAFYKENVQVADIQTNRILLGNTEAMEIVGGVQRFRTAEIILMMNDNVYTVWARPVDPSKPMAGQWAEPMHELLRAMAETFHVSE